jgi:hypothetical protein
MKKNIYILGMICLSITLLAVLFKISYWPGAGILLLAGIGSLALLFLPIACLVAVKSTNDKLLKNLYIAAFISFSVDFIGMLFKIMHWPGAGIFLMIGIPLPFILFLPAYIYYHIKRKLKTDLNFFAVLLFMIYVGVFSSLLSLRPGVEILNFYAQSTNELAQANKYLSANTSQAPSSEISNSTRQLVEQIDEIKHKLLLAYEQEKIIKSDESIDFTAVLIKDLKISIEQLNECGFNKFNQDFEIFSRNLMIKSPDSTLIILIEEIDKYRSTNEQKDIPVIATLPLSLAMNVLTDWQNKLFLINYMQSVRGI